MPIQSGLVYSLELDLTASNEDNHVINEIQTTTGQSKTFIRCDFGEFYSKDFVIKWKDAQDDLHDMVYGVDYKFGEHSADISAKTAIAVYKIVIILNDQLPGYFVISYRAVGGDKNVHVKNMHAALINGEYNSNPISFKDIAGKPDFFDPTTHTHDSRDIFGAEHLKASLSDMLNAVRQSRTAFFANGAPAKDAEIANRISVFTNTLDTNLTTLRQNILAHVLNDDFHHAYTKENVGLGNVKNGDFVPALDDDLNQLPVYVHPKAVADALLDLPDPVASNHATLKNNPHEDSKTTINLGSILNVSFYEDYSPGDYATILTIGAVKKYISPYTTKNAIIEAVQNNFQINWQNPADIIKAPGGPLSQTALSITQAQVIISNASDVVGGIFNNIQTSLERSNSAISKNTTFKLIYENEHLAQMLNALGAFDHAQMLNGVSVSRDKLFAIPSKLPNLYLWLDFSYYANTYQNDNLGNRRLMRLVDRSPLARTFTAQDITTAPIMGASQDVDNGQAGLTVNEVAKFTTGTFLLQSYGPAIKLKTGMCAIAVFRAADDNLPLYLLISSNTPPLASIVAQPAIGVAMEIKTPSWNALKSPPSSIIENTSNICVASIAAAQESLSWFASSKSGDLENYPRGVNTPISVWPAEYERSAELNMVGKVQGAQGGEIAHLLIFNRQISITEAKAVVNYLRYSENNNQALAVDFSIQTTFEQE